MHAGTAANLWRRCHLLREKNGPEGGGTVPGNKEEDDRRAIQSPADYKNIPYLGSFHCLQRANSSKLELGCFVSAATVFSRRPGKRPCSPVHLPRGRGGGRGQGGSHSVLAHLSWNTFKYIKLSLRDSRGKNLNCYLASQTSFSVPRDYESNY